MVFEGLLKINFEEDEDDDEWGHHLSAACCLQKMSQMLKNDVLTPVINFISSHITQESWKDKYSALIALGSITEGPDKLEFAKLIILSF